MKGELAERFFRGLQFTLGILQSAFREHSCGGVAGDLSETDQVAFGIFQRGNDHVGPELRAVFAQPPTFILDAAVTKGNLEFALRLAGVDVLLGIKTGEVFADYFGSFVALDALSSSVPGADTAVGLEHEDGIVMHRLDEELELLSGLMQSCI